MKRSLALFVSACLFASLTLPAFAQQTSKPDIFSAHQHMPLAAIPTMSTVALAPSGGPAGVTVVSIWLSNTNPSTTVTVTITCTTSGVAFVTATIPGSATGGNNIPVQMPADGLWCGGGVTWIASGTGVTGTISGRY